MDNNSPAGNKNFLIAAVLSMAILLGWSYFFTPTKPPAGDANTNANAAPSNALATVPQPAPATPQPPTQPETAAADATPNRTVTIKSPLYEVKLDSRGALATSWVILKSRSPKSEFAVYADGSTPSNEKPLQLISAEALSRTPRDIPFRLETGDPAFNVVANDRNYQISVPEESITLGAGEERRIDFTLNGPGGEEIVKSFVFRGDSYVADLGLTVKKGGQPLPTRLAIGASIGDHAIGHHNFYHIESEAVAAVNDDIMRHQGGYTFTYDANNQASLVDSGKVDWAGVGDAYFGMVAVPPAPVQSVEYKASKYDVQTEPFFSSVFQWAMRSPQTSETRHLVTVLLPVPSDGGVTKI